MIQATGTIESTNGVSTFHNPLINVYMASTSKYEPTVAFAQVGKISNQGKENESFEPVEEICRIAEKVKNPSFEQTEFLLKAALEAKYPTVIFEIV